ncbi:type II secretion system major pseudopilin GspG [Caulobacter sp. 17J65-9]|uniref:type II secretion system major pseudopilin GspG n=1 Tax=Caulobacter sp. 17J65-9 TaxID=2709382 RepID=UPI0013CCA4C0|nr:type II secretion system major pseudopilin GspG [Caulobacter sp. 17J65-9]NEX94888.1 type II secretion system major pseudopilin GspG [Caulobacter sp. 17J65-9]
MRRRRTARARTAERGFSLLEVLIVLTIIALVAALVGPRLIAQLDRSKVTAARVQVRALTSALETLRLDLGRYPTADEGLHLLVQAPASAADAGEVWQGPYLETDVPDDPWGRPYAYQPPAEPEGRPTVVSLGADGREGGAGLAADVGLARPTSRG